MSQVFRFPNARAIRLGLVDEALKAYEDFRFADAARFPGGQSWEWAQPKTVLFYPSMQAMGANTCHIYEMVCRDVKDGIEVLPAWPMDRPLRAALYSSNAGRVEIEYQPGKPIKVATQRDIPVSH